MHRTPNRLLVAVLFLGVGLGAGRTDVAGAAPEPATVLRDGSLIHQGRRRTWHAMLPAARSRAKPVPLVIALHGGGGSGSQLARSTKEQFEREVARRGWVVVFPDGIAKGWNDGRRLVSWRDRRRRGVDDVGFLRRMIEQLRDKLGIDETRVYAMGISNGGFLCYRLALELSDRIAAIAPIAANLQRVHANKRPAHPIGLCVLNGTADPLVPYAGGSVRVFGRDRGRIFSTDETMRRFAAWDGCKQPPAALRLPDKDPRDGTRTTRVTWPCTRGAQVVLYRIEGGGHTWPGGRENLPRALVGRTSRDFQAVPVVFDFFARHRRVRKARKPKPAGK